MGRSMRRALAPLAVCIVLAVSGCAPGSGPSPTATVTETPSSTPTATPTPEALVVGPGEQPPQLFGGDCERVITLTELSGVFGVEVLSIELADPRATTREDNIGGIVCGWNAENAGGSVTVLPQAELAGLELGAQSEECDMWCTWVEDDADAWMSGRVWGFENTREQMDAWGSQIVAFVGPRAAEESAAWQRDRAGWWDAIDCEAVAAELSSTLGLALTARFDPGYIDPVGPATEFSDLASRYGGCDISERGADRTLAQLTTSSGTAWAVPTDVIPVEFDIGVEGIAVYDGYISLIGTEYVLTDGINVARLEVAESGARSNEEVTAAVAEFLVSER